MMSGVPTGRSRFPGSETAQGAKGNVREAQIAGAWAVYQKHA